MIGLHPLPPGLIAVTGGERTGKTSLLRRLCGDLVAPAGQVPHADCQWLDLSLPAHDDQTSQQVWGSLQGRCPRWNVSLHRDLIEALLLAPHQDKKLYMLSMGSRRKVALAGLLACGATVTCLDQPFAALDMASIRVISAFLHDVSNHSTRSWVVADYEVDHRLQWRRMISLD